MIRILLSTELGKRRWKQADLARKTKIRPSTINDYFNELTDRVSLRHMNAICNVLGCDLSEILAYEPDGAPGDDPQADACGVHTKEPSGR